MPLSNQTEDVVDDSKLKSNLNHEITRTDGSKWKITGTIVIKGFSVDYDIVLTDPNGNTYHFRGTAIKSTADGNQLSGFTGDIYDENGNVVIIPDFLEILEAILEVSQEEQQNAALWLLLGKADEEFGDREISLEELLDFFEKNVQ